MTSSRFDPDVIREYVRASRAAQGLPPTIEDPVVRARIAALLANAYEPREPSKEYPHD